MADPKPRSAQELVEAYVTLGIPHFQRGLVWNEDSVSLLLESLYWRTPCGNVILWRSGEPKVHGEPLQPPASCKLLIVDGQQRIRMLHDAFHDLRSDGKQWCLDLTLEPDFSGLIKGEVRARLFLLTADPLETKNPRYKHNLIPLKKLIEQADDQLRARYVVKVDEVSDQAVVDAIKASREKVVAMWQHRLFSEIELTEEDGYGIGEVVALYNRINSAGRRVEAEEIAYATLVRLYPHTTQALREFFKTVHDGQEPDRDSLLKREKERSFGFKLYLRTFVQVCNYHFGRSPGTQGFSFDIIIRSAELAQWFTEHQEQVGQLFQQTHDVLAAVRRVLRETLHCDDLRMLPDTDCLLPALQFLISFSPQMLSPVHNQVVAYLILRRALEPDRTQQQTMGLVQLINRSHTAEQCLEALSSEPGIDWTADTTSRLNLMLKSANTLSDRYVLLLYWLVRKNQAKDFSYENLEVQQQVQLEPGTEKWVAEESEPEKQHIIPASVLGKAVFGGKGRLTTSRHVTNNIGNLTYISHALNHFVTGLGDKWIACGQEVGDVNLAAHFMTGPARVTYERLKGKTLRPEDEESYLEFCEERRAQIEKAFLSWLTELREGLSVSQSRIVPEKRMANPSTADDIRCLGFPTAVVDALVRLQSRVKRVSKSEVKRRWPEAELVFKVSDAGASRKTFHLLVFKEPARIEVENHEDHVAFAGIRRELEANSTNSHRDNTERWVLGCDSASANGTIGVLEDLCKLLPEA